MATPRAVTVSQLNNYIKRRFEMDDKLQHILVEGEISNFKAHSSGHLYFGLKDENAFIRCVMFRGSVAKLKFRPENGQRVVIRGHVAVYERDGQFQLYAEAMEVAGIGDLYLAFEQMKEKLNREGLFDEARKKPLPELSLRIGVVTSPTGAVWHDIQNVAQARFPSVSLFLYPAAVQGEAAAGEIVAGIDFFNRSAMVDLLIVGRGGGSIEDLWAFNTEPVARAIYASQLPVISAVGHETDYTIADLVADKRAATPSQAAEMAVPSLADLEARFALMESAMKQRLNMALKTKREKLKKIGESYVFTRKERLFRSQTQTIDLFSQRLDKAFFENYERSKNNYQLLKEKLSVLSPLNTLARGYSICMKDQKPLRSYEEAAAGDRVEVCLNSGILNCTVNEAKEDFHHGK
ncbi:MAG TPA: exodeoxyribonuclease VII large subunit [Clostridiales bacterium]|nr:exodeoxyribonuclease VII large subunit [Clostridiales bacterium]